MLNLGQDEIAAIRKWNLFLTHLMEAEKTWKDLIEFKQSSRLVNDRLPPQAGKFFGLATSRSTFSVAIERLLTYARKYTSLNDMIVILPEEKKEERKVNYAKK